MQITSFLTAERTVCGMRATCKRQALKELATLVEEQLFYKKQVVFDALMERERLGSTGLGGGIAIPHIRLVGLKEVVGFCVKLENPIDFDAVDEKPVDVLFLILAPAVSTYSNAMHLKALAAVSRLAREKIFCSRLRMAQSPAEIFSCFNPANVAAIAA